MFDPSIYGRAPVISLASGMTLCRALCAAAPTNLLALQKKSLLRLKRAADEAEQALIARQRSERTSGEEATRAVDLLTDQGWSAFRMRLDAYALLPSTEYPLARRAGELLQVLFGDAGLQFLALTYPEQAAHMAAILKRIREDRLEAELNAICGPEFLANLKRLQGRYEAMVNDMLTRQGGDAPDLLVQVRNMARAIVDYATKIAATCDEEEPESITRIKAALLPLDTFRETYTPTTARAKDEGPTPAPLPAPLTDPAASRPSVPPVA